MSNTYFTGFTLNGVHSSDLGILRVMEGSRYTINLLPTLKPRRTEIPGGDGDYSFGANLQSHRLTIHLAFEGMTRSALKFLRQKSHTKTLYSLSFDEEPFKTYYVQPEGATNVSFVPFDNAEGKLYYNGNMTLNFYAPQAMARTPSAKKTLDAYGFTLPEEPEWNDYAGLLFAAEGIDDITKNTIPLYNPGEAPSNLALWFLFPNGEDTLNLTGLSIGANLGLMGFSPIVKKSTDIGIRINGETHLIEGFQGSLLAPEFTGTLYNEHFTSGEFFQIPITEKNKISLSITGPKAVKIEYDYLWM